MYVLLPLVDAVSVFVVGVVASIYRSSTDGRAPGPLRFVLMGLPLNQFRGDAVAPGLEGGLPFSVGREGHRKTCSLCLSSSSSFS